VGSTNRLVDSIMLSELQRIKVEDPFDKRPLAESNSEAIDFRVASELFASIRTINNVDLESLDLITTYQQKKCLPMVA
jgi:ATP-dependent DNA helicase RecG